MSFKEVLIALTIHLLIPLAGLLYFLRLNKQIKNEGLENAPTIELFIIFATYGGLLLVALTTLFWKWSGLASLGTAYLIFGAPIAMGIIAFTQRKTKKDSKYHYWTFLMGLSYFAIAPLIFFLLFSVSEN